MGQRLNIEIKKKGEDKILANCYYHWSAYTGSALELTKEIISNSINLQKNDTDTMKAIKLLQSTGAGLTEENYNALSEEDKKYCQLAQNRNLGLISFTEKGIEDTRKWEEGRVVIEFDFNSDYVITPNVNIDFGVYWGDTLEDKKEYDEDFDENNLIEFDFDLSNMSLQDLMLFDSKIGEIEDNYDGNFKIKGNKEYIYSCIY